YLRTAGARRTLPWRLHRDQRRRRDPARPSDGTRPHHRDGAVRLRQSLSIETVQCGFHALEKPAGAGMAGAQEQDRRAVREGLNASVIASEAKQSRKARKRRLDCFVASLLAMTLSVESDSGTAWSARVADWRRSFPACWPR